MARTQDATLVASAARTTSADGGTLEGFGDVTAARVQLDVTAASGTTPTLDVVLEDTLDGATWNVIGTFTQKTGVSREVINLHAGKAESATFQPLFARRWRVRWTIAGTTPSFTFAVVAALKS